ncbi:tetratricopeptide repeat-containing sensor histidine kinase [Chitinophaga defluvii]|uniref:Tetratricopeptide repeat protein n=1 Tax=Chitinophaga defluvii TaxID=3163343 RepID=A0ABV2TBU3_9BACT
MFPRCLLIVLLVCWSQAATGQKQIDSLLHELAATRSDSSKVKIFMSLSKWSNEAGKYEEGMGYARSALLLATQMQWQEEIAWTLFDIAGQFDARALADSAIIFNNRALEIFKQRHNKKGIAACLGNLAIIYQQQGKYQQALDYQLQSLKQYEADGAQRNIGIALFHISINYQSMSNYAKAQEYNFKTLRQFEKIQDKYGMAAALNNVANTYFAQEGSANNDMALEYYLKSLAIAKEIDNLELIALNNGNIANILFDKKRYPEALSSYQQALAIYQEMDDKTGVARNTGNIGNVYKMQGNYTAALEWYNRGLEQSKAAGQVTLEVDNLQNIGWVYLDNAKNDSIRPSAGNPVVKSKAAYLKLAISNFSRSLALSREIHQPESIKDNLRLLSEALALSGDYSTALLRYQEYVLVRDSIQNDQTKQELMRQAMQYGYDKKADSLKYINQLGKAKLQQQWLYSLAGLLLLAGIGGFFFYRNKVQQARLKAELAKEKAEQERTAAAFQSKMSDAALSSLRSQMNPHFIFNCLNSIRLYAAKNDSASATEYLSKFSRLMRLVLENSKSERITLQQELESLGLYMDMEAMRFKDKLRYEIVVDNSIDIDYIELPPMLIQPYIENAIWHGLMHKEEGGKIEIHLSEKEEVLIASIKDNGVGRIKAAELKSKSAVIHKSFGMNITNERLELINQKYNITTSVTIIDLYHNGTPAGTEVIIKIPV